MDLSNNSLENKGEVISKGMETVSSEVMTAEQIAERSRLRDEKYLVPELKKEKGLNRRNFLKAGVVAAGSALGLSSPENSNAKTKNGRPYKQFDEFSEEELKQVDAEVKQIIEKIKNDPSFDFRKIKEFADLSKKLHDMKMNFEANVGLFTDTKENYQKFKDRGWSPMDSPSGNFQNALKRNMSSRMSDKELENVTFYLPNRDTNGGGNPFMGTNPKFGVHIHDVQAFVSGIQADLTVIERTFSGYRKPHEKNKELLKEVVDLFERAKTEWARRVRYEVLDNHGYNPLSEMELAKVRNKNK